MTFLWYIPNTLDGGHRGDFTDESWGSLDFSTDLAHEVEKHGWQGALFGTSWGRPDTFTVAASVLARTQSFQPLIAIRPGYWRPANFAHAAATLDHLSQGRVLVNIVTGIDGAEMYGDTEFDYARRYDRTKEFLQIVRKLWSEDNVTYRGEFFSVEDSRLRPKPWDWEHGRHPRLYFGGASAPAEKVSATEADVQLFWGEPLDGVAERIQRLKSLEQSLGRQHQPLEFGLRITTLVRDTTEQAWQDAEEKVGLLDKTRGQGHRIPRSKHRQNAVGQQRLLDLAERGEVLDTCLYTTPGKVGGGGAGTTWLVGSPEDVAHALFRYWELGVTHFVLSDTPYRQEIARVGDQVLPLLRTKILAAGGTPPVPGPSPALSA
jgi:alkanesulfonate monooxygenase